MDRVEKQLDELFGQYRAAMPDPEASAEFMPGLWEKIESRRSASRFWQFTRGFATAAAAICLALVVFLWQPQVSAPVFSSSTYVDTLAENHELMAYADVDERELDSNDK